MKKLAVFDVDGTILNSIGFFDNLFVEYSRERGMPAPCLESIKRGYGDPHNHDFKWGVPREEQAAHLYNVWRMGDSLSMSGRPEHTPGLYHGVEEALRRLKDAGCTLAVVTSKPEAPLLHFFEYHGIGKLFAAHRAREDEARRGEREKPAPDQLLSVMRELSFGPEDTVMVGDTTMDIVMGRAAGTHTIGVTWGAHTKDRLLHAGAHRIVETHFPDVVETMKEIF